MVKELRQLIGVVSALLAIAAVAQELRRSKEERTWHGEVFGVPYDFRRPTLERIKQAWWNPDDARLFTPREFGVGWSLNLFRLLEIVSGSRLRDEEVGS